MYETLLNGVSSNIWVDDQTPTNGNAGSTNPGGIGLFAATNSSSTQFEGYLSAWIEYSSNQTANRDEIRAGLKSVFVGANESLAAPHKSAGMSAAKTLLIDDGGDYEAWPYGNVFYDADRDQIALFYTSGTGHIATDKEAYFRSMDPSTDTIGPRVLIESNTASTIHGACLLPNGEYLAFVRNGTTPNFRCNQYRSTDGGQTWTDEGVMQIGGNFVNQALGPLVLSSGTVIASGWDSTATDQQYVMRSTDNGATWSKILLQNAEGTLEAAFAQAANGFIIAIMRTEVQPPLYSYSEDDGQTWAPLALPTLHYSEMLDNPSAILYHPEEDIFEAFASSRKAHASDGLASIWHTVTTPHSAKYGTWADKVRIQTMEGHTTGFGKDCGYPAACRVPDGSGGHNVYLFWYDIPSGGDGSDTNIYYVKGSR